MDATNLAQQILADMWEFGRLILIVVGGAFGWGSILNRSEEKKERARIQKNLILIMLGMTIPFIAAAFLNVQFANIIALMRVKPAWGMFTVLVGLVGVSASCNNCVQATSH
ncbi:MAG: hypothetical protein M3O20_01905 [Acidobacteriota bacterium]|nr:hypothetical protein [Acidobacteriota bacterium]